MRQEPQNGHAGAERAAVQGLRLLGCYLKACAERAAPALTCSLLQSPALAQTVSGMRQALGDPAAADALQEWRLTCCKILPQVACIPILSLRLLCGT